jgi:CelD/BcsL family acetyltransferase involved in cellulose biosynthesis
VRKITHYAELLPIFSKLVDASARSWKVTEGTDLGSLPEVQRFLLEVAQQSGDAGLLETWVLWIDKQVAAFDIYARGPRSLSLLRTDFDLAFRHYGPGNGLRVAIMKDLFEREQVWEYDFGGQNYPYKLRWTKSVRRHNDVTASRPGLFGNVLLLGKRMLPLARKVRSFKKT